MFDLTSVWFQGLQWLFFIFLQLGLGLAFKKTENSLFFWGMIFVCIWGIIACFGGRKIDGVATLWIIGWLWWSAHQA